KLILIELWFRPGRGKEIPRIELVVAVVFERRAMEAVGTRLGDDVHGAAGGAAALGPVDIGLDPHLGDGIDGWLDDQRADEPLVVVHAVEQLIVLVVERAVDRNRRRLATVVRAGATRQRVRDSLAGARHTLDQADEVP